MATLTKRQKEIVDYLDDYIAEHGYAPTLEEIGARFNLSSPATVHKHLTNLEEKGIIRRKWNHSRALELMPQKRKATAIELPLLGQVGKDQYRTPIGRADSRCPRHQHRHSHVLEELTAHTADQGFVTLVQRGA